MNALQVKYTRLRLDNIYQLKLKALEKKHKIPGKDLTNAQRLSLFKRGKVKLAKGLTEISYYDRVSSVFVLTEHEFPDRVAKELKPAIAALDKAHTRVVDEVVLGDANEALILIANFAEL